MRENFPDAMWEFEYSITLFLGKKAEYFRMFVGNVLNMQFKACVFAWEERAELSQMHSVSCVFLCV